jgi:hypothetical protein
MDKSNQKMILLEFTGIGPNQLDEWLYAIPKYWNKNRGIALWSVGINLGSSIDRNFQHEYLVVTEWNFSMMRSARTMIVFLFKMLEDKCEVLISWYPAYEKRIAKTITDAFESFSHQY